MPCFPQLQKHQNIPVIITFFIIFLFLSNASAQDIYINEFLASNSSINQDPDFNEYSDWLELFNAGEQDATLDGFYLTDDLDDSTKWRDRKSTRLNSSHTDISRMPSSA